MSEGRQTAQGGQRGSPIQIMESVCKEVHFFSSVSLFTGSFTWVVLEFCVIQLVVQVVPALDICYLSSSYIPQKDPSLSLVEHVLSVCNFLILRLIWIGLSPGVSWFSKEHWLQVLENGS